MQISEEYANYMCFPGCQVSSCGVWHVPQVAHHLMQAVCNLCGNRRIPIDISANCGYRDTCLSGHIADCNGGGTPSHCFM